MRRFRRLSSSQLIQTAERLEAIVADLQYNINNLDRFPELTEVKIEFQDLLCGVNEVRQDLATEIKIAHTLTEAENWQLGDKLRADKRQKLVNQ